MILCKSSDSAKKRAIKTINITIDEYPKRPDYSFRSLKERIKFIKTVEQIVRGSIEYREYTTFLKDHFGMNRCAIFQNISNENGKKYTIEIHHDPFNLFNIVLIVLTKYEETGRFINPYEIADEVMGLHYEGKVGLIPLSITQHQLVHDGQIFIPLQMIYQDYHKFFEEYEEYIPDEIKEMIQYKVDLSMKCGQFQSNVLNPEFVYVNIDGFDFPEVPSDWAKKKLLINDNDENTMQDGSKTFQVGDTEEKFL